MVKQTCPLAASPCKVANVNYPALPVIQTESEVTSDVC
jgi:hypothetical protein